MSFAEVVDAFPKPDHAAWLAAVDKVLNGEDRSRLTSKTADGIAIQPLYQKASGLPISAAVSGAWSVMVRVDHPDAETANALAIEELEGGAAGLVLVPASEVARGFGAADLDVDYLRAALERVELDLISLRIEPSRSGAQAASALARLAVERRLGSIALDLDFGLDTLRAHGGARPTRESWEEVQLDLGRAGSLLAEEGLSGRFLTSDARIWHEAGATEAQEIGLALAATASHLRALERLRWDDSAVSRVLSTIVSVDADQFLGVAKLRALRRLQTGLLQSCGLPCGALTIHAETSWRMMTRQDPWTNILRTTIAGFAASIGGADSLTVLPHTLPLGLPDQLARRMARNTQHILLQEAHLRRVADPSAGSGAFDALTEALVHAGWDIFRTVERLGGLGEALATGFVQEMIAGARQTRRAEFAAGQRTLVGTNRFTDRDMAVPPVLIARSDIAIADAHDLPAMRDAQMFEVLRAHIARVSQPVPTMLAVTFGDTPGDDVEAMLSRMRSLCQASDLRSVICADHEAETQVAMLRGEDNGAVIVWLCAAASMPPEPAEDATYPGEVRISEVARLLRAAGAASIVLVCGEGAVDPGAIPADRRMTASDDVAGIMVAALDALE